MPQLLCTSPTSVAISVGLGEVTTTLLNIQEEFSSEQTHNKTENANKPFGERKTPTALKLTFGVFGSLINQYWLKEATTAIKILQSSRNI